MTDPFDPRPDDQAAADLLDLDIDRLLHGEVRRGVDPTLLLLSAALRPVPPPRLQIRLRTEQRARLDRRWAPVRVVTAAVAVLLVFHGLGSLLNSEWVARGLGEDHSPHAYTEGGLALLAAGVAVGAGAWRRRWLPVSVAAAVPLGLVLGIVGVSEVGVFAWGALLHLSQGGLALALAAVWWRARRYAPAADDEEES